MLDGDAAAKRFDSLKVSVGNSFAVVEEPVEPFEGHVAINSLEYIEKAGDAFVISSVETERPFVGGQQ